MKYSMSKFISNGSGYRLKAEWEQIIPESPINIVQMIFSPLILEIIFLYLFLRELLRKTVWFESKYEGIKWSDWN